MAFAGHIIGAHLAETVMLAFKDLRAAGKARKNGRGVDVNIQVGLGGVAVGVLHGEGNLEVKVFDHILGRI